MKTCPKCNAEMVHGNVETPIRIYSDEITPPRPRAPYQEAYTPTDAYICKECGYLELYTCTSEED